MISAQMLKKILNELHEITRVNLCFWDKKKSLLYSSFSEKELEEQKADVFFESAADSQVLGDFHFFKVYKSQVLEGVLGAQGTDAHMAGRIAVSEIQNLMLINQGRQDRTHFIRDLLMDNLLAVDIHERAKKLHIEEKAARVVYLVETANDEDRDALEIVRMFFGGNGQNFVAAINEQNIAIVREVSKDASEKEREQIAQSLVDTLNMEAMLPVRVSYGNLVNTLKGISRSFKEARLALEVGAVFYADKKVISFDKLGLGRLIYQLPVSLCELFLKETFEKNPFQELDEETLTTVRHFFENDLNISETARQLYIHRNTLVYRLEKLEKMIGLDIRKFEEALIFKIAMMVERYLKYAGEHPQA